MSFIGSLFCANGQLTYSFSYLYQPILMNCNYKSWYSADQVLLYSFSPGVAWLLWDLGLKFSVLRSTYRKIFSDFDQYCVDLWINLGRIITFESINMVYLSIYLGFIKFFSIMFYVALHRNLKHMLLYLSPRHLMFLMLF